MFGYFRHFPLTSLKIAALQTVKVFRNQTIELSKICSAFKFAVQIRELNSLTRKMSSVSPIKPPNVLVYVGDNPEQNLYKTISDNLTSCLHPDKYVVYELKKSQVLDSPWKENIALLVVCSGLIQDDIKAAFHDYVQNEGKMLVFCSNFNVKELGIDCQTIANKIIYVKYENIEDEIMLCQENYCYSLENGQTLATDVKNQAVILKCKDKNLILSSVHFARYSHLLPFDNDNSKNEENRLLLLKKILEDHLGLEVCSFTTPTMTSGYIITEDETIPAELKNLKEICVGTLDKTEGDIILPLLTTDATNFNKAEYYPNLDTKRLGRFVIYFPVITSTMIPAQNLIKHENVVVIASQQISGKGRSNNKWISPIGSAMFTLPLIINLTSRLGQRMSIVQHMASLSIVHGIRKITGYESLDLRLKWPNDIYFENDKKIGGVLVNTTIQASLAQAFIGIGVNISNTRPTICVNSIIDEHNGLTGKILPLLSIEKVIALALNEFEFLVDDFEKNGSENFLRLYYKYWLHNDQKVFISAHNKEAFIHGLDDYGYLIVKTVDGKTMTLQPDGNRFDMLKNLIVAKE